MNVILISFRDRGRLGQGVNRKQDSFGDTVNITVPCDLVMGVLSQGAILQMQIGPVPLRPKLARPTSRSDGSGRSSRPDSVRSARTNSRPDSGRFPRKTRPARPPSRCPNIENERPPSHFTDWSSMEEMPTKLDLEVEEAEIIFITSNSYSDNDYIPH